MAEQNETDSAVCPRCGGLLSARATFGLCPRCLASHAACGFADDTEEDGPSEFGEYEILEEIARGGMGTVFKARQRQLNRIVALKVITAGALASSEMIERFRNEAQAAASLSHPHIVPIFEIGEHEGQQFFSMELIDGPRLDRLAKPLSLRAAAALLAKIARAIHFAHQRGILHRDIKPGNILVDAQGEPHLTDFGLAKVIEKESTLTQTMALLGTPSYMAPEQARGEVRQITTAADIHGLGAVLYETLTRTPPFAGGTTIETVRLVLDSEPRRPSTLNPAVDRDLETICLKCLEKEPARRYASALALAEDLERWLCHETIVARPSSLLERSAKWARRRPVIAALTAGLGITVLAGFAATLWQWQRAERERYAALTAQGKAEQLVDRLDVERADARLAAGDRAEALALFASVVRRNPSNRIAAERLISFLSQHTLALPISEGIALDGENMGVAPSSDGTRLLTSSASGVVCLWDLASGRLEKTLGRRSSPATGARWSPDGRFVCAGFFDHAALVWDAATGQQLGPPLPHAYAPEPAFSGDGEHLLTYGWLGRTVSVWNWRTGKLEHEIAVPRPLRGMRPSPTEPKAYLAYADSVELRDFEGHVLAAVSRNDYPNVGASTPDGRILAMTTGLKGLVFYDGATLRPVPFQIAEDIPEGRPTFSPDGLWLVMGERLRVGELRDLRTGRAINVPLLHRDSGRLAWLLADGQRLLTTGNDKWAARLCDVRPGRVLAPPLRHSVRVTTAAYSADGRVLTTSADHTARVWDGGTGRAATPPLQHPAPVIEGAFSPNGSLAATVCRDDVIRVWDSRMGALRAALPQKPPAQHVAFNQDGRLLAAAAEDGVWVWDLSATPPRARRLPQKSPAECVLFSPRGDELAVGTLPRASNLLDSAGHLAIWNAITDQFVASLRLPAGITALAFSSDGSRLAIGCTDGTVNLWELAAQSWKFRLTRHEEGIAGLRFSPDCKWIVTAGRDEVAQVLDAQTGKSRYSPLPHHETVLHAEFSSDGRRILTCTAKGVLRLWDAATGLPLTEPMRDIPAPVTAWRPAPNVTLFSPDGQRIIGIGNDDAARVLDVPAAPTPAPAWLAELAETIAGQRMDESRQTKVLTWTDFLTLRDHLSSKPGDDFYGRWVRWFFSDRFARTISPWSEKTVAEYTRERIAENSLDSLFEAVRLAPTNSVVLQHLRTALSRGKRPGLFEFMEPAALGDPAASPSTR